MLDWVERLIETTSKRIHNGLVIAIAFFLAMALKDEIEENRRWLKAVGVHTAKKPQTSRQN